jgi:heterodisulfide reductase subunit B
MAVTKSSPDALFLGCIAPLRFPDIEAATRHVFETLNGGFMDIEGMSCCPTKGSFTNVDEIAALAISGRNIALAEEEGANLVTICNGCFSILAEAKHDLDSDPGKRAEVNEVLGGIGRKYRGSSKVLHFVEYLHNDVGVSKVASSVTHSLRGMRLAIFHGCHYLRPSEVLGTDDAEDPKKIRDLVSAIGGRSVPYIGQLECCGAGGGVRARDLDTSLIHVENRLAGIARAEVEAIVTPCPFCFLQFDIGQSLINEKKGTDYAIPVFHLSQLIALAQGADPGKVAKMSKTPRHQTIQAIQEGGS